MSENSYKILTYLKSHNGATALEVSEATNIQKRLVDSYFSAAIANKDLGYRDTTATPARLFLNEKGMQFTQE